MLSNLNDGMGEACAGQDKARLDPEDLKKVADFNSDENLGALPPTGSKRIKIEILSPT